MSPAERPPAPSPGLLAWLTVLVLMLVSDTALNLWRDHRARQLAELQAKVERGPGHWDDPT